VRTQIDVLLDDYSDAQVAHILNERGLPTDAGEAFDAVAVQWVRFTAKLPSPKQRLIAAGMLTTRQLGGLLGVKRSTISRWRRPTPPQPRPQRQWVDPLYEVQCERHSFAVDVLVCDTCGGSMRILAVLPAGEASRAILEHLELPTKPPFRTRAPPGRLFDDG
jgi:hypothetical protein